MSGVDRYSRRTLLAAGAAVTIAGLTACSDRRAGKTNDTVPTSTPTAASPETAAVTVAPTDPGTTAVPVVGDAYFPPATGDWETVSSADAGLSDAGVAALVEMVGSVHSDSFVLLWQGRIVAEQYWNGADATFTRDLASAQKSVTSTLVGLAHDRGLLALDDPASEYLHPGWSAAASADEAAITIRHLLTMSSGLNPRSLRKDAAPGTVWDYNTDAYQKLRSVLEAAAGTDINTLSKDWLFDAIGIAQSTPWAPRGGLTDAVGDATYGLTISAREMARFGLFAMRRGAWAGEQITAPDWFDEAWTSMPLKRDYGYLWWLLGKGHFASKGAATDLVAALGAQDQKIYVSPTDGLVLTRQGTAAGEVSQTESDFDAALITALGNARA
ncbi:MAG: serine hydrolase [Ilumatobacteraceae bacterium]